MEAVISSDTFLMAGQTAILACAGYGNPQVEFSWSISGRTLANTSLVTIYHEDFVQGASVFKRSFLQLCSVALTDIGNYTCAVSNGLASTNATTLLDVDGWYFNFVTALLFDCMFL